YVCVNPLSLAMQLRLQIRSLSLHLREFSRQHDATLVGQLLAQPAIALCLRGLPFQRVHLPGDFLKDVVDAGQVQLRLLQPRLRQTLAGFELGYARGLFDDGAPVMGLAAEDLPDATLLDDGVGLWP